MKMSTKKNSSPARIAVLGKALDLLEQLEAAAEAKSLDELSSATGIARSTAHRLLADLADRHYVERDHAGRFILGLKLLELGAVVKQRQTLRDIARPLMIELRDQFGETVNLGRLRGDSIIYLETIESLHPFRVTGSLGVVDPVHATSIGKAILASLPEEERPALRKFTRLTQSTIGNAASFNDELAKVKERGYALDNEESMEGGRCIGVPILQNGRPIAGISISGPIARLASDRVALCATALQKASRAISARLNLFSEGSK